jgi:hypothetical protein
MHDACASGFAALYGMASALAAHERMRATPCVAPGALAAARSVLSDDARCKFAIDVHMRAQHRSTAAYALRSMHSRTHTPPAVHTHSCAHTTRSRIIQRRRRRHLRPHPRLLRRTPASPLHELDAVAARGWVLLRFEVV